MTSKKTPPSKRAAAPRNSDKTRQFQKDWDRLCASGRFDMNKLKEVMLWLIRAESPLGSEWKDHPLKGKWKDHRECHIGGDFLRIYRVEGGGGNDETVIFVRAGTHSELFE